LVAVVRVELQTAVVVLVQIQMVLIRQYLALELQLLHHLVVAKAVLQVLLEVDFNLVNQVVQAVVVLPTEAETLQAVQELLDKVMTVEATLVELVTHTLQVVVVEQVLLEKMHPHQQFQVQVEMA
jgi:hypothetical protein